MKLLPNEQPPVSDEALSAVRGNLAHLFKNPPQDGTTFASLEVTWTRDGDLVRFTGSIDGRPIEEVVKIDV